jgi:topoisomerase IA-like protein
MRTNPCASMRNRQRGAYVTAGKTQSSLRDGEVAQRQRLGFIR